MDYFLTFLLGCSIGVLVEYFSNKKTQRGFAGGVVASIIALITLS